MFGAFEALVLITAGFVGVGAAERFRHMQNLNKLRMRFHVSGTRGKSSVARLLAAGLNEVGVATAAKTTGTLARMILPDGREVPVFRPSGANIMEQKRIVAAAAAMGCDAMVIECMALQPLLHWISENRLVRATHGIITNARADHLDVMGPTERDVALTLAGMIPVKGVLYTAERRHLDVLQAAAADRKTQVVATTDADVAAITAADMAGFSYTEHEENVALCLKIFEHQGFPRDVALRGMWKAHPDPGAMTELKVNFFGRQITFVNGFAANDPESTEKIWNMALKRYPEHDRVVAVFNMRADRPSRTAQMARDTKFWHVADAIVLIGSGAYLFARMASKGGFDVSRFVFADQVGVEEVFESTVDVCGKNSLVIGMGNIGGPGLPLVRYFRNRAFQGAAL